LNLESRTLKLEREAKQEPEGEEVKPRMGRDGHGFLLTEGKEGNEEQRAFLYESF